MKRHVILACYRGDNLQLSNKNTRITYDSATVDSDCRLYSTAPIYFLRPSVFSASYYTQKICSD